MTYIGDLNLHGVSNIESESGFVNNKKTKYICLKISLDTGEKFEITLFSEKFDVFDKLFK